jgi:hypothetical protein
MLKTCTGDISGSVRREDISGTMMAGADHPVTGYLRGRETLPGI